MLSASVVVANLIDGNTPIFFPSLQYTFYTCIRYINIRNEVSIAAVQHKWPSISPDIFYAILPVWQDPEEELERRFGATLVNYEKARQLC
jgi:hypothetical protein